MKKIFALLPVIVVFFSCMSFQEGVTTETDEFSGQKRVFATMVLYDWMSYSHSVTVAKQVNTAHYYGYYTGLLPEWYFIDRIGVKIDHNQPVYFQSDNYERDVISGDLLKEVVFFDIDRDLITELAEAETVQIEVSGKRKAVLELKEKNFETLKAFLEETTYK
jgi:hypothetical protein